MKHRIIHAVAILVVSTIGCSRDNPFTPQESPNLLMNPEFRTPLTVTQDVAPGSVEPWTRGTGTPQIAIGVGCGDTTRGYMQMWGNADLGECLTQTLATPIKKGKTYIVTACVKWWNDDPQLYTQHVKVRFIAFNQSPGGYMHWQEDKPNIAVIGSIRTSEAQWRTFSTAEWTADSDYTGFGMNVENDTRQDGTAYTVSWALIDNVTLKEKSSQAK